MPNYFVFNLYSFMNMSAPVRACMGFYLAIRNQLGNYSESTTHNPDFYDLDLAIWGVEQTR